VSNIEPINDRQLFQEIRQLIDTAKQRAAVAVNAELTLLYWQVGQRIQTQILQGDRAEYGKQIINTLSEQLTQTYGKGWSEKQLRHCVHFAETFPDLEIVPTLGRQLSWTHLKTLMLPSISPSCLRKKCCKRNSNKRSSMPDCDLPAKSNPNERSLNFDSSSL
jgi:hypothetical protein